MLRETAPKCNCVENTGLENQGLNYTVKVQNLIPHLTVLHLQHIRLCQVAHVETPGVELKPMSTHMSGMTQVEHAKTDHKGLFCSWPTPAKAIAPVVFFCSMHFTKPLITRFDTANANQIYRYAFSGYRLRYCCVTCNHTAFSHPAFLNGWCRSDVWNSI